MTEPTQNIVPVDQRSGGEIPAALVARFAARFSGYTKAHGRTKLTADTPTRHDGKKMGRSATVHGPATLPIYVDHLSGTQGLGVIMLRDDNETALFGAIDLDTYGLTDAQLGEWQQKVQVQGMPLVLCRTKSGGCHMYLFLTAPGSAELLRHRLSEYASMLGLSAKTEIFPKQSSRLNDADTGSFINLPYFQQDATVRYLLVDGTPGTLEQFLDAADLHAITPESLHDRAMGVLGDTWFKDGPPCLQAFELQGGFPDGGKRNGMVSVAVYLQKAHPDDWEQKLANYNERMAKLRSEELVSIQKSTTRKKYQYMCSQTPINAVCQKGLCRKRLYGVGGDAPDSGHSTMEIEEITKYEAPYDDPIWIIVLNGKRVQLTNAELYSVDLFNQRCLAAANVIPANVTGAKWRAYLQQLVHRADVIQSPEDAGQWGQVWAWAKAFCTQNVIASGREGLVQGKVFVDAGRVYFRSKDFMAYLKSRHVVFQNAHSLWAFLRDRGGENGQWNVKQKCVNWWSLPAFEDGTAAPTSAPAKADEEF